MHRWRRSAVKIVILRSSRQIVGAAPSVLNFCLPEKGQANRTACVGAANFTILQNHPITRPSGSHHCGETKPLIDENHRHYMPPDRLATLNHACQATSCEFCAPVRLVRVGKHTSRVSHRKGSPSDCLFRNVAGPIAAASSAGPSSLVAPESCAVPGRSRICGILTTPLAERLAPKRSSIAPA